MLDGGGRVRARTFADEDPGPMRAAARSSLVREASAIGHRAPAPPARVAEHKISQPYRTAAHTARDPELSVPWRFDFDTDTGWQGVRTTKGKLPSTASRGSSKPGVAGVGPGGPGMVGAGMSLASPPFPFRFRVVVRCGES